MQQVEAMRDVRTLDVDVVGFEYSGRLETHMTTQEVQNGSPISDGNYRRALFIHNMKTKNKPVQ